MLKTVYNFDKEERLTRDDMESGYSVAKSLNNLYEKHGSLNKKMQSPGSKLLTSSSLIRNRDGNKIEKTDVCLTAKQMNFIDMLVRQKTCMLLTVLNETMNLNLKNKQIENQKASIRQNDNHEDNSLLTNKKQTNKRVISNQTVSENRKKLIGVSPLICKSSSSINLSFQNYEPIIIKPKRRVLTHDITKQTLEKKDNKTKSKIYSNKYGKSKNRKQRQLTIMMRINEESENEDLKEIKVEEEANNIKHESIKEKSCIHLAEDIETKQVVDCYKDYQKILMLMS